jgi:hypothetical protein
VPSAGATGASATKSVNAGESFGASDVSRSTEWVSKSLDEAAVGCGRPGMLVLMGMAGHRRQMELAMNLTTHKRALPNDERDAAPAAEEGTFGTGLDRPIELHQPGTRRCITGNRQPVSGMS